MHSADFNTKGRINSPGTKLVTYLFHCRSSTSLSSLPLVSSSFDEALSTSCPPPSLVSFCHLETVSYCLHYVVLYSLFESVDNSEVAAFDASQLGSTSTLLAGPPPVTTLAPSKICYQICKSIWMPVENQIFCQLFLVLVNLWIWNDVACIDDDSIKPGLQRVIQKY